ncbi:hypothetical protein RUND412_004289 [Rhizina undulata]
MVSKNLILASYRCVYKAGLAAIQFSTPARYAVRDKIRKAFRSSPPSAYSQLRIDNTVEFLRIAARRRGIEHQIIRNLCLVHYWQQMRSRRVLNPAQRNVSDRALANYYETITYLNQTLDLDLR